MKIELHPTSIPIIPPKASIRTSSLTANLTKASDNISTQPYTIPQPNTMYPSPHQWTIPSSQTPPPSKTTQPPLSITSNLSAGTHISVPPFRPYTINVHTCGPLSSQFQIFDGTDN